MCAEIEVNASSCVAEDSVIFRRLKQTFPRLCSRDFSGETKVDFSSEWFYSVRLLRLFLSPDVCSLHRACHMQKRLLYHLNYSIHFTRHRMSIPISMKRKQNFLKCQVDSKAVKMFVKIEQIAAVFG